MIRRAPFRTLLLISMFGWIPVWAGTAKPGRIVTLNPLLAEWTAGIIGPEYSSKRIAGVSDYSSWPAELKKTLRTVDVAAQRVRSYIVRGPDPKQQTGAAATGDRAAVEAWVMAEKSRQRTRAFSYEEVPQSRGGFSSRSLVSNLSETPVAPPHPPPSVNATPTVTWRSNNIAVPTMHEWMNYSAAAEHYSSAALKPDLV
ncbi:MAG: hypothetical protein EBX52_13540, partial [Proteobacteria bacterium]|nr:hypothetical protein [Pseudomonadota bacterium]